METTTANPPRRWSKRALVIVVSSLIAGVVALVVGIVGVTRSASFVLHGVDAAANVSQIAPDRVTIADNSVPLTSSPPSLRQTPVLPNASVAGTSSSTPTGAARAAATATSGGAASSSETTTAIAPFGGVAGQAGSGGAGGTGGLNGMAGAAGTAGASPTFWETTLQSVLAVLGQTTISMCGRNTCNVGQVCCNPSCGTCTAPGASCDQAQCAGAARTPTAVLCGRGQCNDGQVCCNASCGICAAPGESCSDQECR